MTSSAAGWPNPVPYDDLSERQQEILQFLWDRRPSYAASMREIGTAIGLTAPSAVRYQLTELEAKGWVRRHPGRPRAMEVRRHPGRPRAMEVRRPDGEVPV
jgi:repressor LexA